MTLSLTLASLWVLAATITALLPMRFQYKPGLTLLILALPLLIFIGIEHSFWVVGLVLLGIISMFRRPLAYFARRGMGLLKRGTV